MGFLESLGQIMSKLFASQTRAATQQWVENMTLEDIEEMERQGCDMTEYRQRYEEHQAKLKADYERRLAMLDYPKLEQYMNTPRDPESDFVKDTIALGKLSSKDRAKMLDAKIIYGAVVQAHSALWEPRSGGGVAAVFVFAMDDEHMYNEKWLLNVANKIGEMKESNNVPKDNEKFIKTLRDSQSMFCFKLGESLSGGADAWCGTFAIDKQEALPDSCMPVTHILPLMMLEYPEYNYLARFELIPSKYYTK